MTEVKKDAVSVKREGRDIIELDGLTANSMSQIKTVNNTVSNNDAVFRMLLGKYDHKDIIRGQISGVSTVEQKKDGSYYFTVTVRLENELDCEIEDSEFTMPNSITYLNYDKLNDKQKCEVRMTHAVKMMGAWVPVMITSCSRTANGIDEAGNYIFDYKIKGSRKKGMDVLKDKWYFGENMLRKGDITDAYILYATESYVRCEILGVETTISFRECCAEPIRNCKTKFHSGDIIRVVIGRISIHEDKITVIASGRLYEIANRKNKEFDKIKEGGVYFGYVSHMSRKGHYIVQLSGFKGIMADVQPNKVAGHIRLNRGDMVCIVCTHKVEDGMFIIGTAEKK